MNYTLKSITLITETLLIVLLCVSCNKPRFATNLEEKRARYIKLVTQMPKHANSSDTGKFTGLGVLSLQSTYPLQRVECLNCIDNGTLLKFEKQPGSDSLSIYEARFNFSYVQNTQACKLDISALYADDPDSPINKSYSIMLCPLGDGKTLCNEESVEDNCSNIKTLAGN